MDRKRARPRCRSCRNRCSRRATRRQRVQRTIAHRRSRRLAKRLRHQCRLSLSAHRANLSPIRRHAQSVAIASPGDLPARRPPASIVLMMMRLAHARCCSGGFVTACNKRYHPNHFGCYHCGDSLMGQCVLLAGSLGSIKYRLCVNRRKFSAVKNEPYCVRCFIELFANRCERCKRPIDVRSG